MALISLVKCERMKASDLRRGSVQRVMSMLTPKLARWWENPVTSWSSAMIAQKTCGAAFR